MARNFSFILSIVCVCTFSASFYTAHCTLGLTRDRNVHLLLLLSLILLLLLLYLVRLELGQVLCT